MATTIRYRHGSIKQEQFIAKLTATKLFDYAVRDATTSARARIDYLLSCPDAPGVRRPARPLSAGQDQYARNMAADLDRDADAVVAHLNELEPAAQRAAFDALVAEHRAAKRDRRAADELLREAAQQLPVMHGYVLSDGRYARTYRAQNGGGRAKVLCEDNSWDTIAVSQLTESAGARPITPEDAKIIASRTQRCGHCGLTIERPESLAIGYGPDCAAKF